MKYLIVVFFIVFPCIIYAQNTQNKYDDPQNMDVNYTRDATYPGGDIAFFTFVAENLKYPNEAIENKVNGDILISFDVNLDGSLSGFNIISGVGYGVDEALITLLKTVTFETAIMNGTKVKMNTMYTFPIYVGPGMTIK